jgi:hypothetical protein
MTSGRGHDLVRQLAASGGEPAHPGEELQQQPEPQPSGTRLVPQQGRLVRQQREVPDKLIKL